MEQIHALDLVPQGLGIDALATVLQPTSEALQRYVLAAPVISADDTWWRFLQGRGAPRWWAWSVTREDAVAYTILDSRSQHAARQVPNGYTGIVIADGYGAYDALARAGPSFYSLIETAKPRRGEPRPICLPPRTPPSRIPAP